ncbi:hypothetical protein GIB67_036690 [Kingdonia uniflora]|uniref:AB hydrolase-1 domain-containing protein n=1 Tax=Kingdonia uniflora TaxID=39325 RepID=A0A7J7LWD3_9MAGN|nr:hypothetical protein GIB67_036690 [Kingdonia uniflora]
MSIHQEDDNVNNDVYLLGKAYFDCKEYRRASHALRDQKGKNDVFLRSYALYLMDLIQSQALPDANVEPEREYLAATFVNALVNAGFGQYKLMTIPSTDGSMGSWFRNEKHMKASPTASLAKKSGATTLFEEVNKGSNNESTKETEVIGATEKLGKEGVQESTKEAEAIGATEKLGKGGVQVYEFENTLDSIRGGMKRIFYVAFVDSRKLYLLNIAYVDRPENPNGSLFNCVSGKLNSVGDQYSVKAVENFIGALTKLEADLLSLDDGDNNKDLKNSAANIDETGNVGIVLVHGFGGGVFSWRHVMSVDLLLSFCLKMGFSSVVLVGHDDGGLLALMVAQRAQESRNLKHVQIRGIVLIGVSLSREVVPAFARILLRTSLGKKHLVHPLLHTKITQVPLCVECWDEALHEIGKLSSETFLSTQKVEILLKSLEDLPVLVVAGAEDALVSLKSSQVMASKLVNFRLVAVSECGHLPHEECPKALLAGLLPFISRLISLTAHHHRMQRH